MSSEPAAAPAPKPSLRAVLASPKMLVLLAFGAASGYPNQLSESALQAWLKDAHVTNTQIGLITYVAIPYLLKPLWAPLLDRYAPPWLGRRRGWILLAQLLLAAAIGLFALQDPATSLASVTACALLVVFLSATQDIVIDAYRADVVAPAERGFAVTASTVGYRAATYLALAATMLLADAIGWHGSWIVVACVMALFAIATLRAPEPERHGAPPATLREAVLVPLRQLLDSATGRALLALVMIFKLGDAFSLKLFTPFVKDLGFTNTEIAVVVKIVWLAASVAGSVLAGVWMVRLGLLRAMLLFGVMQALSNLAYYALALAGKNYPVMIAAAIIEHLTHAMGNVAVVALMMALCDARFSAFQYALLTALSQLPRYGLGYPAGWVADHAGWPMYYVVAFALGLPGLAMVWLQRARIQALDGRR
ncbi:MAG: MFS transporter [Proteobacteria bacterium]|nr:MFS transporter [Pseudomonadota bacterium]